MGWMDDPEVSVTAASANVGAPAPGQWWEKDPLVKTEPRAATGISESFQAGIQGSAPGLAWRQKLPDLVMDPEHARWWERAAAGIAQVGAELPLMAVGGAAVAPVGAAIGGAAGTAVPVVGNVAGAAIGGILGTGAGMFAVPAAIRESLIQAYKSGDVRTSADWWNILREVATTTVKEGAIGAATFGAGSIAARTVGKAIAPAIGESIAIPTATKIIGTADTAAQIATMVTMPAALQGRLPDAQEFLDAAIVIGGLKAAHPIAARITNVFQRTGRTPAQQVEDAKADPKIAEELKNGPVPEEPWIPSRLPEYTKQEELWSIQSRLGELEAKSTDTPDVKTVDAAGNPVTVPGRRAELFTYAEKQEYDALKVREAAMEAQGIIPEVPRETSPPGSPRYAPDQLTAATERAKTRLEDLATKSGTEALTDAERAERVLLTNAMGNPEALAKRFGMEPAIRVPTSADVEASAQRVYDDVLRQAKEADSARQAAGNTPIGDEHAQAVAALVRARVRTRAARLGMLPEEIYNEKPLQIRDETQQEVAQVQAEAAAAPELPRLAPPEVDLFGNPVEPQTTPRYAVENMATVELPLKDLVLSKEVPQFKAAANAEGVIVPLGGKFDRTGVGPIQVWERTDGTLEVISGRHRLDLARRSGEETIPAQIHREADGFDARQAATLDAQLNIREEQGSVADYAQYFKDAGITKEAADELGLLARAKGRTGFAIARDASPDLLEAHRAGLLSDDAALAITGTAPGSERLQALGIAMVNDGKSILMATNTMRAVGLMAASRMAAGQQGDIFGFDDSAMREAASMAKKASSAQRKISEQISAVSGASKRPELARKIGVDVQDPEGIQKKIAELKQERYQWDNWPLYPELVAKLRAADLKQDPLYQTGTLAPSARDWKDAPLDDTQYITRDEYYKALNPYVKDGVVTANSRLVPNDNAFPPLGSWRIDTNKFTYGREIEKLVELPIDSLLLGELDSRGRLDPAKAGDEVRYAAWIKDGKRPPPIEVVQTEEGRLSVTDGHRRALAAKLAGAKTVEAWVNFAVPVPDGWRYNRDPNGKQIRTGMTYEMLTGEIPNPYLDRLPLSMSFDLKPETPAELKARDEEAAAAAKRKLAQERAGVKGPVPTVDQADLFNTQRTLFQTDRNKQLLDAVLEQHGEDRFPTDSDRAGKNQRISVDTANKLAKKGDPDAGPAALIAYVTDDFLRLSADTKLKEPATKALIDYVKQMPGTRTGPLYRVLGFDTQAKAVDFLMKFKEGETSTMQSERPVMSFTTDDPTGKNAFQNIGIDQASVWGDHLVVLKVQPRAGATLTIGRDVSSMYGANSKGVDVLVPKDQQFQVRAIEARDGGGATVTLEPVKGMQERVLFQDEKKPWYYSELARSVEASPMKQGTAKAWQDYIKSRIGKGVKPEEIEATGINDWLATQEGKVTKEQVAAFMEQGGVKVTETMKGGPEDRTPQDAKIARDTKAIEEHGFMVDKSPEGEIWGVIDPEGDIYAHRGDADGNRSSRMTAEQKADWEGIPDNIADSIDRVVEYLNGGSQATQTRFSDYQEPGAVKGSYRELVLTLPKAIAFDQAKYDALGDQHRAAIDRFDEAKKALEETGDQQYQEALRQASRDRNAINDQMTSMRIDQDNATKQSTFESSHFPGSDYLAHTRVNDRVLPDGRKVLFVEEIQSDRAQKGRTEGFSTGEVTVQHRALTPEERQIAGWQVPDDSIAYVAMVGGRMVGTGPTEAIARQYAATASRKAVPTAPFVTKTDSWTALVLKRLLRYAAEGEYDAIAWTRGEQQVERYTGALRKAVDLIEWKKTPEGVQITGYKGVPGNNRLAFSQSEYRRLLDLQDLEVNNDITPAQQAELATLARKGRNKVVDTTEKENAISDAIGKSMADRIIKDPNQTGTIEGENININDTGMAGYYDRIVPKVAEKVAKQVGGGKVTEVTLGEAIKEQEGTVTIGGEDTVSMVNSGRLKDHELSAMEILEGGDIGEIRTIDQAIAEARGRMMDPDQADVKDYATQVLADLVAWKQKGVKITYPEEVVPPSKQMAIEITPAMREKIMAGMPLFQKPGQERDGQHLGSYSIADNLITTFRNANKSTVIHELSHSWLEEMRSDAMRPNAPAQIKADWDLLRREFAIGETGEISTASHEQFARTGERYFGEGVAPSVGLRGVFERFKAWMLEIYGNLQNLGVTINPEVKGVFDRMIATDQEIADAKALDVPTAYVPEARRAEAEKIVQPPEARKIEPGFAAEQASMKPYADELPKGPGEAPDNSHINYAYINSPMDVKLAMQRMAEIDQANIQKQRGGTAGVKSWAEANAEQARYVNDILDGSEDTLRLLQPRDPNAAGPDVKLGILKKLAVGAAKDSARLRDVVLAAGHDATVRQQLEYMGSIERARMIQAEFLGERAGVARALNALKDVTEGSGEIARMLDAIGYGAEAARELFQTARTPAEEQAYMRAQLDAILQNYKGKTVLDIAKLHKEIGTLKGTFKMAKDIEKASTWEMIVEGWRSGLLSGPVTHTTNLFGTGAFQALRAPVDALAAVIGMARGASPGMGESDRASMSEAIGRITGMLGGVKEGFTVGYHTFMADQTTGKTESYREAIPGRAGELIRIPLRLMGAEDAMVSTMYLRGELRTLAIRQAFNEHMNPGTREFATRVDYLMDHPTPEIQVQAEQAATRMTFNMPLGEKGVALQLFVQKWNLQWMIPFIRTPVNIAKELLRMSPFAPAVAEWRQSMAKGGVERDRALAEIALGTGITALTMAYAFSGDITGGTSPDPGKNRAKAGVWQPYSIKIGDTWYEYARIQPIGTLIGMAADIAAIWDHMNDEEKDKLPKMLAAAFAQAITNQTFLQGITNFVNAMSDPTRFGPRFLQQFAGSMVPNVIGQPTTMADPVVREVNGMIEAVQARIPGFRQQLLPKRDWLGEPVQTKERTGLIMPVREQPISKDKVRIEADRLGLSVAAAPKKTHIGKGTGKLGDVEFTPEERDKFEQAAGQMAHPILTNIVNAPGYDAIPDLVKRKIFANVLTASHKFAAAMALPVDKKLAYIQQITERVQQELQPTAE